MAPLVGPVVGEVRGWSVPLDGPPGARGAPSCRGEPHSKEQHRGQKIVDAAPLLPDRSPSASVARAQTRQICTTSMNRGGLAQRGGLHPVTPPSRAHDFFHLRSSAGGAARKDRLWCVLSSSEGAFVSLARYSSLLLHND